MRLTIKSITLENFKGVKNKSYSFNGNTIITGCNGAGKSTIASAYYWVFGNISSELQNNPNVFPIGALECTPTVKITLDIDGREVTVEKMQKRKITKSKEDGNADSVSISSTYKVNEVEHGERDFKNKMKSYGVDMDKFLELSHPDVFTNQMATKKDLEKMRNTIFSMGSTYTDLEVAEQTDGVDETKKLLKGYFKEEIEAMQNTTLRKIREIYGNDGEILRATIEGMERSKTDINASELELQRNVLKEQIAENKAKQDDISKQYEEQQKAADGILELKFQLSNLQRENKRKQMELKDKISYKKSLVLQMEKIIEETKRNISSKEKHIENETAYLHELREKYIKIENLEFDEKNLTCPYCGNEYKEDKKEEERVKFQRKKDDDLSHIIGEGDRAKDAIIAEKARLIHLKNDLSDREKELEMLNVAITNLEKQLSEFPLEIDVLDAPEILEIKKQIEEKEVAMKQENSADEIRRQLKYDGEYLQLQLIEVEKKLAPVEQNAVIDENIAELRNKQKQYEIEKAKAEKIKYQLSMIDRRKNELLSDSINRNFKIVEFKLFDWLKNGEYKSCCIPTYKGKDMGVSTNTGLELLMKTDIIRGLQTFYNQYLPVFLDGAECLSEETVKKINMDCQLVILSVSEDKNLKVKDVD